MPDGHEFGNPDLVLGQDRLQRVVPALLFRPVPQTAPRRLFPGGFSRRPSLVARCPQVMRRGGPAALSHTLSKAFVTKRRLSIAALNISSGIFQDRTLPSQVWMSSGPAGWSTPSATAASTPTCSAAVSTSLASACRCPAAARRNGT